GFAPRAHHRPRQTRRRPLSADHRHAGLGRPERAVLSAHRSPVGASLRARHGSHPLLRPPAVTGPAPAVTAVSFLSGPRLPFGRSAVHRSPPIEHSRRRSSGPSRPYPHFAPRLLRELSPDEDLS